MRKNNQRFGPGLGQGNRSGAGPDGNCVCPKCGYEKKHQHGIPCSSEKCPKCHVSMIRQ